MGDDPSKSVVNPVGETWEVENLYVADTSVLPTATGVPPMVCKKKLDFFLKGNLLIFILYYTDSNNECIILHFKMYS